VVACPENHEDCDFLRSTPKNEYRGIGLRSAGICCSVVAAALSLSCQHVSAQSSLTLGGMTDISIRYLTNDDAQNDGRFFMANGAVINSHFGLHGTEDLGNGLKAVVELENNFNPQNGSMGDSGRLFDSTANVGLSGDFGAVTFGRQDTPLFYKLITTFDPLTYANYPENSWLPWALEAGLAADNSIRYIANIGGLSVGAMYSFGGNYEISGPAGFSGDVPGHFTAGSLANLLLSYTTGALDVGAGVQQLRDNSNHRQTVFNLDARYSVSDIKIYAGWLYSQDNTGLIDTLLAEQSIPDISRIKGTDRIDNGPFGGFAWQVAPSALLSTAIYYDHMQNATTATGALGSGSRYTVVALAEYSLSKRTELYGTVDFNKINGAAAVELPGRSNQTGIAVGLRNFF
jgi:predicted porin